MRLTSSGVVLVLLVAAGCASSDNSFTEDYNEAVKPLSRLEQGMGTSAREFDRLARGTRETRRNLEQLDPPDEAQDELDALVAQLGRVTDDLSAVAAAARSHDVARQRRAAARLVRSSSEVERVETALKQAVEG